MFTDIIFQKAKVELMFLFKTINNLTTSLFTNVTNTLFLKYFISQDNI